MQACKLCLENFSNFEHKRIFDITLFKKQSFRVNIFRLFHALIYDKMQKPTKILTRKEILQQLKAIHRKQKLYPCLCNIELKSPTQTRAGEEVCPTSYCRAADRKSTNNM